MKIYLTNLDADNISEYYIIASSITKEKDVIKLHKSKRFRRDSVHSGMTERKKQLFFINQYIKEVIIKNEGFTSYDWVVYKIAKNIPGAILKECNINIKVINKLYNGF